MLWQRPKHCPQVVIFQTMLSLLEVPLLHQPGHRCFASHSLTWRAWSMSCTVPCASTSSNSPWSCHAFTASASYVPPRSWWRMATRLQSSPRSPTPRPPHPTPAPPDRPAGPHLKPSSVPLTVCFGQVWTNYSILYIDVIKEAEIKS